MSDIPDVTEKFYELLAKLSNKEKSLLLKCFEEVSEKSYRRGVQQALHFERERPNCMIPSLQDNDKVHEWRFKKLVKCEGIDGYKTTIAFRLSCEHGWIHQLAGKDD